MAGAGPPAAHPSAPRARRRTRCRRRAPCLTRSARPGAACPVALAREGPVDVVLQPLAEAPVLDVVGVPGDRLVGGEEAVALGLRRDVPRRLGVVEERRAAAPAVRVGVLVLLGAEEQPALPEVLDEVGVGLLDPAPGVGADALVVGSVEPDRVDDGEPVLLAEAEVVLAEGDRRVDDAGAVLGGDEVADQHGVRALAPRLGGDEVERRAVARALDRAAREALEHLGALAEHALDQRLGEHRHLVRAATRART